ncbi:hypothetical protein [Acinetobacter baumannii]|uniref:hypothetical protein n=1 Tax=Acinetobacter baumannii TaxID=470 RepID=UPI000DF36823|nr:hypothetical protein [Acinetobacter baumannii]RCT89645.1 hypothetical protein DVA68_15700 [Acinetobacter baumannii]
MVLIQPSKIDFNKAGIESYNFDAIQAIKESQDEDSKTCFYLATFVNYWAELIFNENKKYQFDGLSSDWNIKSGFWSLNGLNEFKFSILSGEIIHLNTIEYSIALNLICLEHQKFKEHKYYGDVAANRIVQLRQYLNLFLELNKKTLNSEAIKIFINFGSEKN